jgi:hypothetical protein
MGPVVRQGAVPPSASRPRETQRTLRFVNPRQAWREMGRHRTFLAEILRKD